MSEDNLEQDRSDLEATEDDVGLTSANEAVHSPINIEEDEGEVAVASEQEGEVTDRTDEARGADDDDDQLVKEQTDPLEEDAAARELENTEENIYGSEKQDDEEVSPVQSHEYRQDSLAPHVTEYQLLHNFDKDPDEINYYPLDQIAAEAVVTESNADLNPSREIDNDDEANNADKVTDLPHEDDPDQEELDLTKVRPRRKSEEMHEVESEEEESIAGGVFKSFMHGLKDDKSKLADGTDDDDVAANYPASCSPHYEDYVEPDQEADVTADVQQLWQSERCGPLPRKPSLIQESSDDIKQFKDDSINALNMCRTFGFNTRNPVLNLSTDHISSIFYSSSHTGVIYDRKTNSQILLQGHLNVISCTTVSFNKRWIVTAEKGPRSTLIVWDSSSHVPVKTIFDCHPDGGVECCALTRDSRFLATVSATVDQVVAIWDWTTEADVPICTAELSTEFGLQKYVIFNPEDGSQLITNSDTQVIFYAWHAGKLDYYTPPLTDTDFGKVVGNYTQSIYFTNSSRALTGTSVGNFVVWEANKQTKSATVSDKASNKKALKLIKISEYGITTVTTTDNYIVTGDAYGQIKFYEQGLTLVYVYNNLHISGSINSISFLHSPDFFEIDHKGEYGVDSTPCAKPFIVRDFVLSTTSGVIASMKVDGRELSIIRKDHDAPIHALSAHPSLPILAMGSYSSRLQLWQYTKHIVIASRKLEEQLKIETCCFDPRGEFLAIGCTNGSVRVLDAVSLNDVLQMPFHYSNDAVTHITFSHNSKYFATADVGCVVTIYKKDCQRNAIQPYVFIGRYKSHYKPVSDLVFAVDQESRKARLLSVGEDRYLVEYDLENSQKDNVQLIGTDRIEQSALPLSIISYPLVGRENLILTSNNAFKLKLYNASTKVCRKTIQAPMLGGPLKRLAMLSYEGKEKKFYLGFINDNKVGVTMLPLDGNPHSSCAVIAHPEGVSNVVSSYNGKYLFTAGSFDGTVHMWAFNKDTLEAQSRLGGEGIVPFLTLLENNGSGSQYGEIEQLFYYAQIKNKGLHSQEQHEISTKISLAEAPYMMRALGFYPSEHDIEEMLNEVKYSNYVETGNYTTHIDIVDFVKLYVNHRPAYGTEKNRVEWAFKVLGVLSDADDEYYLSRDRLLQILRSKGERMSENELIDSLCILLGLRSEGGIIEAGCPPTFSDERCTDSADLNAVLPTTFTADTFIDQLLSMH